MSKKPYRKYSAATMAAVVAATAVVPVVALADEKGFPDVTKAGTESHYENILALQEAGIVKGDPHDGGKFRPFENITRVQVALMLQRALELDVPANPEKVLEKYTDIHVDQLGEEHVEAIAALSEANVFTGNEGKFRPWEDITREQMASVIVRAYKLNEIEVEEDVEVNFDKISKEHRDNVQVLANLEITTNPQNFRAFEQLSRQQFASFLKRSMDVAVKDIVAEEIVKVTVSNIEDPINAEEEKELTFTVIDENGFSKKFTKAQFEKTFTDYTVKFYYADKSVLGEKADDGIVTPKKGVEQFKYQVEILNPYKDPIAERSNVATVNVQDKDELAAKIVEVTELELQDEEGNKLDAVRPDQVAKIVATKGKNALGEVVENPNVNIEKASFSVNDFGYVTLADGTINLLNTEKNVGKTETLTVTFAEIDKDVMIDITVAEKGIPHKLVTPSIKSVVNKEVNLINSVQVFNQYGEEVDIDSNDIEVSNITGENAPKTFSNGKATFTKAGKYTVYYKVKGLQKSAVVTVIEEPNNDNWAVDFSLDINGENKQIDVSGEDGPETLEFTVTGVFEGADVTHLFPNDVRLEVRSENENVATVALEDNKAEVKDAKIIVKAVSEGATTITVTPKQGDMPGQAVAIQIDVIDSTITLNEDSFVWKSETLPQGTELTEKNLAHYLTVKDINGEEVDVNSLQVKEILNIGQGYIITFDKKHGVDDNGYAFDTFINFAD